MPKVGQSDQYWENKLRDYANGLTTFGRGEYPSKPVFRKKLDAIQACPRHGMNTGKLKQLSLTGMMRKRFDEVECKCGYHKQKKKFQVNPEAVRLADQRRSMKLCNTGATSSSVTLTGAATNASIPIDTTTSTPPIVSTCAAAVSTATADASSIDASPTAAIPCDPETVDTLTPSTVQAEKAYTLPQKWLADLPHGDAAWIDSSLMTSFQTSHKPPGTLWMYPPQPRLTTNKPKVSDYFLHRLFVWFPRRFWKMQFRCKNCDRCLTSKSMYQKVRWVLDLNDFYLMVGEYYECKPCKYTVSSWSEDILVQMDISHRQLFTVICTHMAACDIRVITLLRNRSQGNSSTALAAALGELHAEEHLRKVCLYLDDCKRHKTGILAKLHTTPIEYDVPPAMRQLPSANWLLTVYKRDAAQRLPETKASITSVFGSILKMDSTKKITKKLVGDARGMAGWCTNIGNENGEILNSVLTSSEGAGLEKLASGIVRRYAEAGVAEPAVIYVDRDCCRPNGGGCRVTDLFAPWKTAVRLDIFHYMRRLSLCCTSEAHPLYSHFMGAVSAAIFIYDENDLQLLRTAKYQELIQSGIPHPTDKMVEQKITKSELLQHCKRSTAGPEVIKEKIDKLLQNLKSATDILGVPLLNRHKYMDVWVQQQQHLSCIQDPPGVSLYVKRGELTKAGVVLPTYKCHRGSSSLESFHLHLNRFVPGTAASAVNMQLYLLEGLSRWNKDRRVSSNYRSYDLKLTTHANYLAKKVFNAIEVTNVVKPRKFTGELIGIEYLFSQSGEVLSVDNLKPGEDAEPEDSDEGVVLDESFSLPNTESVADHDQAIYHADESHHIEQETSPELNQQAVSPIIELNDDIEAFDSSFEVPEMSTPIKDQEVIPQLPEDFTIESRDEDQPLQQSGIAGEGVDDIPGLTQVVAIAEALVALKDNHLISYTEAERIVALYNLLEPFDRKPTAFEKRYREAINHPKCKQKSTVVPGKDNVVRLYIGSGLPAATPTCNRIVQMICTILHRQSTKLTTVLKDYQRLRQLVMACQVLMTNTNLTLPNLSSKTLKDWHTEREKKSDLTLLKFGHPGISKTTRPLPEAEPARTTIAQPPPPPHDMPNDPEIARSAVIKMKSSSEQLTTMSRTTEWRKRKLEEAGLQPQRQRIKPYSCGICKQPKTAAYGHRREAGNKWFCPKDPRYASVEEWLSKL